MQLGQLLDQEQPDPHPALDTLPVGIPLHEGLEDVVQPGGRDADPGVADLEHDLVLFVHRGSLGRQMDVPTGFAVFGGIVAAIRSTSPLAPMAGAGPLSSKASGT